MAESEPNNSVSSGLLFRASEIERGLDDALDDLQQGAMPEPGNLIGGKYRVERLIACGGMGAVYEATHKVSGKRVAVKWMLPTLGQIKGARERFIREACATARIAHPNIVDIYDVGTETGSVYLVMEFLRGETLAQRIARSTPSEQEAIALLMPALRGVAAAHAHGVIHRDLKPDNIFLCCDEAGEPLEPKVLDFGISKITTDEVRDLAITHSGGVLGTPYYMSPEQVRGAREVDERTDVYAFGVMLFEAVTGQWPFDAETYNELILKIATENTPRASDRIPELHPELVDIIQRAMARDVNDRYPSIESLALALEPFAGGVPFRNTRTPRPVDPASASGGFRPVRVSTPGASRVTAPASSPASLQRPAVVAAPEASSKFAVAKPSSTFAAPDPSGTFAAPEPSGMFAAPDPSGTFTPEPSGTFTPEPSGVFIPEPSGAFTPEPSQVSAPEPSYARRHDPLHVSPGSSGEATAAPMRSLLPLDPPPRPTRARVVVGAVLLVACAAVAALALLGRDGERAEGTFPTRAAPQPTAADVSPPSAAAVATAPSPGVETSVNAAQDVPALVNANGSATATSIPAAAAAEPVTLERSHARAAATKGAKRLGTPRERRAPSDASAPVPDLAATKRLPNNWDDRIGVDAPRLSGAAELPAGRISARDFR